MYTLGYKYRFYSLTNPRTLTTITNTLKSQNRDSEAQQRMIDMYQVMELQLKHILKS